MFCHYFMVHSVHASMGSRVTRQRKRYMQLTTANSSDAADNELWLNPETVSENEMMEIENRDTAGKTVAT